MWRWVSGSTAKTAFQPDLINKHLTGILNADTPRTVARAGTVSASRSNQGNRGLRYGIFAYTTFWLLALFVIAGLNMARPDLLSPIMGSQWQKAALHSIWFAMLGGVAISFKGLYDHWQQDNWTEGKWTLWYIGRPFSSAVVGAVTYLIVQVTNPNSTPNIASLGVAAFVLGTQERRFFNLLYEVAKLVLSVPGDPGPDGTSAAGLSPTASPTTSPSGALSTPSSKLITPPTAGVVAASVEPDTTQAIAFVDKGGTVLRAVKVQLIYWGRAWSDGANPSAAQITDAVKTILASAYTSALSQYRGIGAGSLQGSATYTQSDPPNSFSTDDVANFVHERIKAGLVPEPDSSPDLLYCVIMPTGVSSVNPNIVGEHSYCLYADYDPPLDIDVNWMHFAWVSNDGSLGTVTTIFSHELVESCTDPEGTGVTAATPVCTGAGWCEIGDVCSWSVELDGVMVQSYWSQRDAQCVVPGSNP